MKFSKFFAALFFISSLIVGCKDPANDIKSTSSFSLDGFAQKGPFTIGSKVVLSELSATLNETGRNFNGSMSDDKGSFSVTVTDLASNFTSLSADGFYFNEVVGGVSTSRLVLNALADVTDSKSLNINVLTHLTYERIKFLVKAGTPFKIAKSQAEKEVLAIFKITDIADAFEKLDISKNGDPNAILLAISVILQGNHTVGELSELLAKISLDIKEDGKLDSDATKSELINEATFLDVAKIRANITKRFQDLGVTATIGNFEKYITSFLTTSGYVFTKKIIYPKTGSNGLNILAMPDTTVASGNNYVFAATLEKGMSLKIIIRDKPMGSPIGGSYAYSPFSNTGWTIDNYTNNVQNFSATSTAIVNITLFSGTSSIELYENGATKPTRIINLVSGFFPTITFDNMGKYGSNILKFPYSSGATAGNYSLQMGLKDVKEREVKIEFYYSQDAKITFANAEGWTVETVVAQPATFRKTTLYVKAIKADCDVKVTLQGTGDVSCNGTIDGVNSQEISKKFYW